MDVDSPNSLKRCSSAPQINNLLPSTAVGVQHHLLHHTNSSNHQIVPMDEGQSQHDNPSSSSSSAGMIQQQQQQSGLRSAVGNNTFLQHQQQQQQQPSHSNPSGQHSMSGSSSTSSLQTAGTLVGHRDPPPTSFSNIFAPRARRFSASFSPLAVISNGSSSPSRSGSCTPGGPRLTPRISQLRQEECADLSNSREVNHEREIHSAIQMSQSYEDLTLVTENWSFKSGTAHNADDLANPLHVALPSIGTNYCSSPSPTSRAGLGLQYPTTSPSPTRKFVTRRSMSPCPIRPSPLSSSVKRKFDLEDNNYGSCYSPPPLKKIFTSSDRGSSPVCQTPSPSPICPSPDSSTASFENGSNNASSSGRITPKFFMSKLSSSTSLSSGSQSVTGNGGSGGTTLPSALNSHHHTPAGANGGNSLLSSHNALHGTDSSPSSLSSSSLMMMDCGVSSSSMLGTDGAAVESKQSATVSSSDGAKIDCDEDITDRGVAVGLPPTISAESSEAVMEEVMKSARPPEPLELLHAGHRLSSGSSTSDNNNSESSSSLCPLVVTAAAFGGPGTNGASGGFLAEIAET